MSKWQVKITKSTESIFRIWVKKHSIHQQKNKIMVGYIRSSMYRYYNMPKKNKHIAINYEEEQQLLANFPQSEQEQLKQLLDVSSNLSVPTPKEKNLVWKKILLNIGVAQRVNFQTIQNKVYAVAASMAFLVAAIILVIGGNVKEVTKSEKHKIVYLPNSSTILMNVNSTLSYNKYLWMFKKSIQFQGEAFFQAQKGEPLEIHTKSNIIFVLGTSFNVFAREDEYSVTCFTGKVKVATNHQEVFLTPSLSTTLKNNRLSSPFAFDKETTPSWGRENFYLEDIKLEELFNVVERQFEVTIFAQKSTRRYTGYFDVLSLDQTLKIICGAMGLQYEVQGKIVKINTKNSDKTNN